MTNEDLLAAAAAKAVALTGLVDALEYGTIRVLRVDGLDHLYVTGDDNGTYDVTVSINGEVRCNGYAVTSTARDLAYAALTAARTH